MPPAGTTYDPQALLAAVPGQSLRSIARRLGIDPAMFYKPWSERQADRYAIAVGLHPGDVWPHWWTSVDLDEIRRYPRTPGWSQRVAALLAAADGTARAMRRAALVTRCEAARQIGVSESRLRHWEAGRHRPAADVADRYAEFLATCADLVEAARARSTVATTMHVDATNSIHR